VDVVVGIGALGFVSVMVSLVAVAIASWRRTGPLRRQARGGSAGQMPPRPDRELEAKRSVRASWTTHLAWVGGGSVTLAGAGFLGQGRAVPGIAMVLGGAFVAVSGAVRRVTGIRIEPGAVVILRAMGPGARLRWDRIVGVRPPILPIGGWRIRAVGGSVILMPSDLLGCEGVLATTIVRAGLVPAARGWRDPASLRGR